MRPPICAVCHDRFATKEGGLVRFADYEPLPERVVGHPKGLEWFCGKHHAAAEALSHLATTEALRRIRRKPTARR
ncbi:MAG: hypothetical protein HKN04_02565 [Rhodothermaceae bacterium]|nr:hypothetical protein [Rhodothermaceae bacterium]